MRDPLRALNRVVADGVIETYAIGGGIGAAFHLEPSLTEELEVLVLEGTQRAPGIEEALILQGGVSEAGRVRFGAWPLRLILSANALMEAAIREALSVEFAGIPARVCTAEHLCALALQAGSIHGEMRAAMFVEEQKVDRARLAHLAGQHGLIEALRSFDAVLALTASWRRGPPAGVDPEKLAMLIRMKPSLRERLRALSWEDKVAVIESMNATPKWVLAGSTSSPPCRENIDGAVRSSAS